MKLGNYECKTTFWSDFTIAERFGHSAVKDTFRRAFKEWKTNAEFLTELSMVLNWKSWAHYEAGDHELATIYSKFWEEVHEYAYTHLKGDDLSYYWSITD